ncbi:zinc knuckle CX2CX4HX4C containing protein [Tanacetum coccineum]
MTSDKRKSVMDALFAMSDAFLVAKSSVSTAGTPNLDKHVVILDDVIFELNYDERQAAHALVLEVVKGFNYVNSGSDTSSEEPIRGTPGMVLHIDEIVQFVSIQDKPSSYVSAAGRSKPEPSKPMANFRSLFSENLCEGVNFSIPRKVVETVSTRFANTLYGYFIGLEDALENGPWMIRNSPIILKKWSMNTRLCKEELTRIPVWVKIHDIPIQVFSEDGLSIIASQIESLTMGVPLIEGSGFTIETVNIEYEWKPPRCDLCKIFGHVQDHCPKKVLIPPSVDTPVVEKTNDGFQMVGKKKKSKSKSTNGGQFGGHSVKQNIRYEPKATANVQKKGATNVGNASKSGLSQVSTLLKISPLRLMFLLLRKVIYYV